MRDHRYVVSGTILQFSGLTEISPSTTADAIDLGSSTAPTPLVLTAAQLAAATPTELESYEGRLVTVAGLAYVSGTWSVPSNTTPNDVIVTDGPNNVTIRLFVGSTASTPPNYPVTVTGIFGQSDNLTPFTSGYAILPRDDFDVVSAALNNYAAWAATQWPGETDAAIIGFESDPDHDGILNGAEHAFGFNPKEHSLNPYFSLSGNAGTISFSHPRAKSLAVDVTLGYEWSTGLGSWFAGGVEAGGVTVTFAEDSVDNSNPDYDVVTAHATVTTGAPETVFVRFRASK